MKRPLLITIVTLLQLLLGLLLAGLTIYVLALTRSPEIMAEPDAADAVRGLLVGATVLGVPAVITLAAWWGLWKGRFWGWVLSLGTDVGMLGVGVYSIVHDNNANFEMLTLTVGFLLSLALLLVPEVKRFYWAVSRPA